MSTRYFMGTTPLGKSEREMQLPPGFRPRGGGVMTVQYTSQGCDCRYCTKSIGKEKCQCAACICFIERLFTGCVPYEELLCLILAEIDSAALAKRVKSILPVNKTRNEFFLNPAHRKRFENLLRSTELPLVSISPAYVSAIFLLAADDLLFRSAARYIHPTTVNFDSIDIKGMDFDSYTIFQTAKDLYRGILRITLSQLKDPELIDDELFRLIINSFIVRRYGMRAIKI